LQQKVDEIVSSRDELQQRVGELIKARDAALADAQNAQARIDKLTEQLQSQVQQVTDLRDQIKTIRSILDQLQQKLK